MAALGSTTLPSSSTVSRRCDGASTAPRRQEDCTIASPRCATSAGAQARLSASIRHPSHPIRQRESGEHGRVRERVRVRARAGADTEKKSELKSKSFEILGKSPAPSEQKSSTPAPPEGGSTGEAIGQGSAILGVLVVLAVVGVAGGGYVYRDELNHLIAFFTAYVEEAGPVGYLAFTFGYAALEVLAVPAIPLTMSAGLIFGPTIGTVLCSASATMAATVAFLIARYVARDRILNLVKGNKKYEAIDRALGEDSFRVVTLLRLSPLLPFSLGNYVYGLTSIRLGPYVLGSWLGMLPGTWAYVSAGAFGRTLLEADEAGASLTSSNLLPVLAGLGVTIAAAAYVGNLAKNAIKGVE